MLPIVQRELLVAAHDRRTTRARVWGAIAAVAFASIYLLVSSPTTGSRGAGLFHFLLTSAFLVCCWESVRRGAACIATEKEEGTLGLLFLTDLRGHDVILGKLATISIRSIHALLGFFPILAVSLLGGGVTGLQLTSGVAGLLTTLVFCLSLAIFTSTVSATAAAAQRATLLLLFLLILLPGLVTSFVEHVVGVPVGPWKAAGLWQTVGGAWESSVSIGPFWANLAVLWLGSATMLFLAGWLIPRSWQKDESRQSRPPKPRSPAHQQRLAYWLNKDPVVWLGFRESSGQTRANLFCLIVFACGFIPLLLQDHPELSIVGWVLTRILNIILLLWIASHMSRTAGMLKKMGGLDLVLGTPLTVPGISKSLERGFWVSFAPQIIAIQICWLLWCAFAALASAGNVNTSPFTWGPLIAAFLLNGMTLALDAWTVSSVALWQGIVSRDSTQAFLKTLILIVGLAVPYFCLPNLVIDIIMLTVASPRLPAALKKAAAGLQATVRNPPTIKPPPRLPPTILPYLPPNDPRH